MLNLFRVCAFVYQLSRPIDQLTQPIAIRPKRERERGERESTNNNPLVEFRPGFQNIFPEYISRFWFSNQSPAAEEEERASIISRLRWRVLLIEGRGRIIKSETNSACMCIRLKKAPKADVTYVFHLLELEFLVICPPARVFCRNGFPAQSRKTLKKRSVFFFWFCICISNRSLGSALSLSLSVL